MLDRQISEQTALCCFKPPRFQVALTQQQAMKPHTHRKGKTPVKMSGISALWQLVSFLRVKRKDAASLTTGQSSYYWEPNRNP